MTNIRPQNGHVAVVEVVSSEPSNRFTAPHQTIVKYKVVAVDLESTADLTYLINKEIIVRPHTASFVLPAKGDVPEVLFYDSKMIVAIVG